MMSEGKQHLKELLENRKYFLVIKKILSKDDKDFLVLVFSKHKNQMKEGYKFMIPL